MFVAISGLTTALQLRVLPKFDVDAVHHMHTRTTLSVSAQLSTALTHLSCINAITQLCLCLPFAYTPVRTYF